MIPKCYPQAGLPELEEWRDRQAARELRAGAAELLGRPSAWYDNRHWICTNGHVMNRCIHCADGYTCIECFAPTVMGPQISQQQMNQRWFEVVGCHCLATSKQQRPVAGRMEEQLREEDLESAAVPMADMTTFSRRYNKDSRHVARYRHEPEYCSLSLLV